ESDSSRISFPSRFRVLVAESNAPGSAGSGICLTQTITFIGRHCYRSVRHPPNQRPATVGRVRILLVVNAFASSVTARNTVVVHRALSTGNHVELVETNR